MSPKVSWDTVARWTRRVGLVLLVVFAAIGWSLAGSRGNEVDQLLTVLSRNPVVTAYNVARSNQQDCIASYNLLAQVDDAGFKADIAAALIVDQSDADAVARAKATIAADHDRLVGLNGQLRDLPTLCPAPTPPTFDNTGRPASDPVIPTLHPAPPPPH